MIALDWKRREWIEAVSGQLRASPLPVRLLPNSIVRSLLERRTSRAIGLASIVDLHRAPLTSAEKLAKRFLDTALASVSLLILPPLMLLAALAIKFDSQGLIIFSQRRIGFDERPFKIYKFRTMSVQEDGPEVIHARRNDPRVTWLGAALRQCSIDVLPHRFNVLKSDMSLIGPRPHAVPHHDQYRDAITSYAFRHNVKPGMIGWAQVNGVRGETRTIGRMARRGAFDLWYIDNWSLLLDLKIIWRTFVELMRQTAL